MNKSQDGVFWGICTQHEIFRVSSVLRILTLKMYHFTGNLILRNFFEVKFFDWTNGLAATDVASYVVFSLLTIGV